MNAYRKHGSFPLDLLVRYEDEFDNPGIVAQTLDKLQIKGDKSVHFGSNVRHL